MKPRTILAALVVACSCLAAQASVISLNFVRAGDPAIGQMAPADVAGVVPVANWNTATSANANLGTGVALGDENGLVTTATADWASGGASWSVATDGTGSAGDKIMMTGYLDQSGNGDGQIHLITISGIPFAQYDVYLYHSSSGGPNRTARYQANTIDIFTRNLDPANTFNGFTQAGYGTLADAANLANPAGNYVRWEGLTGATLSIEGQGFGTIDGGAGGDTRRAPIQGIQIVQVPEPGVLSLLVLTLGGLLRRRR